MFLACIIFFVFSHLYAFPEHMHFAADEARDAGVVYGLLEGEILLQGPSMSIGGFYLNPFFYYTIAPFFALFNGHPAGGAIAVLIAHVCMLFILYTFLMTHFSKNVGNGMALFYAFSYWIGVYSSWAWNPHFMPLISALSIILLFKLCFEQGDKRFARLSVALGVVLGLGMGFHAQTVLIVGFAVLVAAVLTEKPTWFFLKRFVAGFMVFQVPVVAQEMLTRGDGLRSAYHWIVQQEDTVRFSERIVSGFSDFFILLERIVLPDIGTPFVGFLLFLPAGIVVMRKQMHVDLFPKTKRGTLLWLLCGFVCVHLASFFIIGGQKYLHFIAALFPVVAILFGILFDALRRMERIFSFFAVGLCVVFVLINTSWWHYRHYAYKNAIKQESFDVPYTDLDAVVRAYSHCDFSHAEFSPGAKAYGPAIQAVSGRVSGSAQNTGCNIYVGLKEEVDGANFGRLSVLEK